MGRLLNKSYVDWTQVLENNFKGITNNYKLIQFQYKLLMRISTCKYMRHKMKIVMDDGLCIHCKTELETLEHIFLKCPHTLLFINKLQKFIKDNIDVTYKHIEIEKWYSFCFATTLTL